MSVSGIADLISGIITIFGLFMGFITANPLLTAMVATPFALGALSAVMGLVKRGGS